MRNPIDTHKTIGVSAVEMLTYLFILLSQYELLSVSTSQVFHNKL